MKKILLINLFSLALTQLVAQNIATVRGMAIGNNVTVRGVAINGAELGVISYVQDVSGGIAVYGTTTTPVNLGDSIVATGTLYEFRNLIELSPLISYSVISAGKIPNPLVISASQFGEAHEGILVKVKNCVINASGSFGASATNYTVTSGGQTFVVRSNTLIAGQTIPTGTVDITGVGSQFCTTPATGCTTGYQLLLRTMSDIVTSGTTPTSLIENKLNTTISVYPNPTKDTLNFKLESNEMPNTIIIKDVTGKIIFSMKSHQNSINVSGFVKGIYYLTVITEKNNYKTSFVID